MILSDKGIAKAIDNGKIKIKNAGFNMLKNNVSENKEILEHAKDFDTEIPLVKYPVDPRQIQPASLDIRLGDTLKKISSKKHKVVIGEQVTYEQKENNIIGPKEFVLATTKETIVIPDNIAAVIDGRSSIGRLGLHIENAGWIDPGFAGEITLELFNSSNRAIELKPGVRIGQLVFKVLDKEAANPYRGKYYKQKDPTGSMLEKDYENKLKRGD